MKSIFYYGQRVYDADEVDAEIAERENIAHAKGFREGVMKEKELTREDDMELYMTTDSGIDLVKKEDSDAEIAELVDMLDRLLFNPNFYRNDAIILVNKHHSRTNQQA